MKKRLRKKKHRGEFREWGCHIDIRRNRKDGLDEFLDAFILEAVERTGCYCGGGGREDQLGFVIELGRASNELEGRLNRITAWLRGRSDVHEIRTGRIFDVWHDDIEDIESDVGPDFRPAE